MPHSMTGFGRSSADRDGASVSCEIRSVNHRFLSIKMRVPPPMARLEPWIEGKLRGQLKRGSVEVFVQYRAHAAETSAEFQESVADRYLSSIRGYMKKRKLGEELPVSFLLQLPGVFVPPDSGTLTSRLKPVLEKAVVEALEQLTVMRQREGERLEKVLRREARSLRTCVGQVAKRLPRIVKEHQQRLRERVDQLLEAHQVTLDDATLAREVAVYADRTDVTEEIDRLESHLGELDALLEKAGPVGRSLDFLVQELSREVHTLGSKTQDKLAAAQILKAKATVEKLREQVQNIE